MSAFSIVRRRKDKTGAAEPAGAATDLLAPDETARLIEILRRCVEAKTRGQRTARRTLEDAFRVFDVDKSETISAEEFAKGCAPFLQGVHPRTVHALFATVFDVDGSGSVGLDEFISALLEERPLRPGRNSRGAVGQGRASAARASQVKKAAPATKSRNSAKFRAHIDGVAAERPSRSAQDRRQRATEAQQKVFLAEKTRAPFFDGDRPELGPNGAKIGAKTGGAANNKRKLTSSQQRKRAAHAESAISQLRERIVERGGTTGIQSLSRVMKIMDDSGDRKLSREELKYGLADFGMPLSAAELVGFALSMSPYSYFSLPLFFPYKFQHLRRLSFRSPFGRVYCCL